MIDDICLVRSMTTDAINHDPAHMFMNTGSQIVGRPSMGAWITYGLGTEAADLPGFVVLTRWAKAGKTNRSPRASGAAASCPAATKACNCAARANPCCISTTRPGSRASNRVATSRAINALNRQHDAWSMIPKSPRASRNTRWRSRCKPACRN